MYKWEWSTGHGSVFFITQIIYLYINTHIYTYTHKYMYTYIWNYGKYSWNYRTAIPILTLYSFFFLMKWIDLDLFAFFRQIPFLFSHSKDFSCFSLSPTDLLTSDRGLHFSRISVGEIRQLPKEAARAVGTKALFFPHSTALISLTSLRVTFIQPTRF